MDEIKLSKYSHKNSVMKLNGIETKNVINVNLLFGEINIIRY